MARSVDNVLLGICRQNSNSSASVWFISSVFYFVLREYNKEAGRLLAQQRLLPFRAQVDITERGDRLEMGSQYSDRGIDLQERLDEWYVNETAAGISVSYDILNSSVLFRLFFFLAYLCHRETCTRTTVTVPAGIENINNNVCFEDSGHLGCYTG